MNRYMVGMTLGLLLLGIEPVESQTGARVEYRSGRVGVAVAIGDPPVRAAHPRIRVPARGAPGHGRVSGRVVRSRTGVAGSLAVDWGRVRLVLDAGRPYWRPGLLKQNDLRRLLGKGTVKRVERHARFLGLRGPLRGQWLRLDRRTMVLELTTRGRLVAELYDYGMDGYLDQLFLVDPSGPYGLYPERRGYHDRWNQGERWYQEDWRDDHDRWDDDDGWDDDDRWDDHDGRRYPRSGGRR